MDKKAIYVVDNSLSDYLKIGMSKDPIQRAKSLSTSTSIKMNVLYTTQLMSNAKVVEELIHKELKDFNVSGEWFNIALDKAINTIKVYENSFKDLEEIPLPHISLKQKEFRQVNKLPTDYKRIDDYIVKTEKNYYISYDFLGTNIVLAVPYKEQAEEFVHKLGGIVQKI